ncbi:DNA primase [Streptomyces sp. NPDC056159]|uniref:DNA primase n=1 Tax=Streptomyces sp. NPDC056159 TaxID=3155537 RepID=UPI0034426125
MNRVALGLAIGAGYVLGRTKKMKFAFAVGSLVAGKRMQLSPKALEELVNQQLRNNPQFKEIGDQLRQNLRGVGKAASGALVERQIEGLAERLHGRTDQVREQLSGVVPEASDLSGLHDEGEEAEEEEEKEGAESAEVEGSGEASEDEEAPQREAAKNAPAKKRPAKQSAGTKAAAKKTATSARKAPAKNAAAAKGGTRRATSGSAGERRR